MDSSLVLVFAFLIGAVSGLRSLTAPAVVTWAAHLKWIKLQGTLLAFMASPIAVGIFTLAAVGELVADKLPNTPSRTAPPGVIARALMGGLSGAGIALAGSQSIWIGAVLGVAGGMAGMFAGYQLRTRLVRALNCPDFVIALLEDAVAIGGGLLIVTRF